MEATGRHTGGVTLSDQLEAWLTGDGDKTLGGLIELFEEKAFAIVFVLLMGVPALPLPTGGATHVFEIISMLLALQLIVGRERIWLPDRWHRLKMTGKSRDRFLNTLMKMIRRLEKISRPRLTFLYGNRVGNAVFGVVVIAGAVAAFVAPPFSGLDTLPSLGVVLVALSVLLEDVLVTITGVLVGAAGVVLEIVLGSAAVHAVGSLF
jgi:hypothetical protein